MTNPSPVPAPQPFKIGTGRRGRATLTQQFCKRVRLPENRENCWEWTGATVTSGYPSIGGGWAGHWRAHRLAYTLFIGPIPGGFTIDHLCRNRLCVNPSHLEAVTQRENNQRGDSITARNIRKTHCSRGHAYTPENTWTSKLGHRQCRTCDRDTKRAISHSRARSNG